MNRLVISNLELSIGNVQVCNHLSQVFQPGQIWAVLGRNGTGKTTLLHTLCGLRQNYSGHIILNGRPLMLLKRKDIATQISILLQHYEDHFPTTVMDVALSGRFPHSKRWFHHDRQDQTVVNQVLKTVSLEHKKEQNVLTLSGGERRRLALASVFAQNTSILLLDEPLNHIDIHYQMDILKFLQNEAQVNQKTIIMVLHDINTVQRFCSHVLMLLGDGRFLAGKTRDLLSEENLSAVYQHEFKGALSDPPFWVAA